MSGGISGGKQVICLFPQNETTIIVLQNVQFEFRQVLRQYCLL